MRLKAATRPGRLHNPSMNIYRQKSRRKARTDFDAFSAAERGGVNAPFLESSAEFVLCNLTRLSGLLSLRAPLFFFLLCCLLELLKVILNAVI